MKARKDSQVSRWVAIEKRWREDFPHVAAFLGSVETFSELRLKGREDGTCLAIAKGYGDDGGPIVCFGVGYDVITALMAIDATMQGGHWREDKPWKPGSVNGK